MSKGLGAIKKKRALKAREKQTLRKAAKKIEKFVQALPKISEDDLLSFQFAHFGDDSKPEQWFVKPEDALEYQPELDDGLGWYEDGVKRTLTDEEIAVFRRTEEWQLERAKQKLKEKAEAAQEATTTAGQDAPQDASDPPALDEEANDRAQSPASEASSLEEGLMAYAGLTKHSSTASSSSRSNKSSYPRPAPRDSRTSRSATPTSASGSTNTSRKKKRKKSNEVPYDQRHKRKWESHIVDEDPVEGSLTHRRLARELDDQKERRVEMDY